MRLESGAILGPYEISGSIGAGGMGEVYRARDPRLGRDVALKVLPREVTADPERLARFEREARSLSALNHPNIVTVHDFGGSGEASYLVMELVQGESLRGLISRGPVAPRKLATIAAGIASGLAAAHGAGIVHRDLKPENVMITADGAAKILDFGLARAVPVSGEVATEVKFTNTGVVMGTATYMAPEQARGAQVGIEADQFALGLMLFEMATGRHPFRRASAYETVTAILNDEHPSLEELSEPLAWIVERCLAKDPRERYASTSDLARDLQALRERGSSPGNRVRAGDAPAPSRKWGMLVAVAAGLVLVATLLVLGMRPPAPAIAGALHFDLATAEIAVAAGEVAVPVAISPDGTQIVASGRGTSSTSELWLYDLRTSASRLLAHNAFGATWSDDGRAIAFFADGQLKTIPAAGGPTTVVCAASPEGSPAWSGETILFVRYSGGPSVAGLYRVTSTGGTPERIIAANTSLTSAGLPWWPTFLPGGKRFLYTEFRGLGVLELMAASLDGGLPQALGPIASRMVFASGHLLYVRDGALMAHPFDAEALRFTGEARPLIDGLHVFRNTGMAAFSAAANGTLVWRSARRPAKLAWYDRTGVETEIIATEVFDLDGRLSPDGNRYAAGIIDPRLGSSDLWIYDLLRGSSDRITTDTRDEKAPVWALDGQKIYHRSDGGGGPPDIFLLTPGAGEPALVHKGPAVEHPEDLSPDGKWLLFTTLSNITSDIHMLPLDPPGDPRPIAATPFNETSPRFSPDGQWIAYASDLSGRAEIYVRRFEGTGAATRVSRDGGTRPQWSGRELFFLGPGSRLMSIPFDGTFGTPSLLFEAANAVAFEPATDGRRFLMQIDERRNETSLHILVNWERLGRE